MTEDDFRWTQDEVRLTTQTIESTEKAEKQFTLAMPAQLSKKQMIGVKLGVKNDFG
jgi:hypothetical protein